MCAAASVVRLAARPAETEFPEPNRLRTGREGRIAPEPGAGRRDRGRGGCRTGLDGRSLGGRRPERPPPGEQAGALDLGALVGDARRLLDRLRGDRRPAPPRVGAAQPRLPTVRGSRPRRDGDRGRPRRLPADRGPLDAVRLVRPLRDQDDRRAGGLVDKADGEGRRPPVVLGGPLPGNQRRHRQRDPHPGADASRHRGHDRRRDPQLLGA